MLVELLVENYAVVERARLRFHRGLNLLTGETGSGKSIVVDSLALLFGGRSSADLVRSGADRTRITGIFELPADAGLQALIDGAGVEAEDGELLIAREILPNGKSRAFAGGRPVTAAFLRDAAPFFGDIHGQHEQQRLFSADAQLAILDEFAQDHVLAAQVRELYREWASCRHSLAEWEKNEQEKLRLADLWTFQRNEIESAQVKAGEDTALENERVVLKNVTRLQEAAAAAYDALYDAPESASSQLRAGLRRLEELCRIDANLAGALESVKAAEIAAGEASAAVRDYLDKLEPDPARLDEIEGRLATLERLKRKYGPTLVDVLAFLANAEKQLGAIETAGERRAALEARRADLEVQYRSVAGQLRERRLEAARELSRRVERELKSLALAGTEFRIDLKEAEWSEDGIDRIEFLISANTGEEARPLERVASGGELSRIALALKTAARIATRKTQVPRTLVFDEVDAGIGGAVAEAVGRRLKELSQADQVLCVTHLAQVAGFADHHYLVEKREVKGRTVAEVEELSGEARTREIGRMLSGQRLTPEALKHAEQLLKLARE
ncbi:MAG: DNA repair protein RecN [Bryobacteraceae bacterium]